MSRRGPAVRYDSLELLLDIMCNTFGGIILISLLIALATREVNVNKPDPGKDESALKIQRDIEKARADLQAAKEHYERVRKARGELAERQELAAQRDALQRKIADLEKQWREAGKPLAPIGPNPKDLEDRWKEFAKKKAELEMQLAAIQAEIQRLRGQLAANIAKRREEAKELLPPMKIESNKDSIHVIIRYGRIYRVRLNRHDRNSDELEWSEINVSGLTAKQVDPKPGRGIQPAQTAVLQQWLRLFDPRQERITCIVYDDSFPTFIMFRGLVSKERVGGEMFEIGWMPRNSSDPPIRFSSVGANIPSQGAGGS